MKKGRLKYLLRLFVLCTTLMAVSQNGISQEIRATAAIDSTILPIGQQSMLHYEVIQPKDVILNFPFFADTLVDKVEILDQTEWDSTEIADMQILIKKDLLITSFDSGLYYIPPVQFGIQNGGGFIESNPLVLKVITFEVDTAQGIFDIKTVKDVPYTFAELVPWLIGAAIALIVVFLFIYLFKRINRKEPIFVKREKPKEPAHVIAIRSLDELKASKLWQKDQIKEFYTRLTDIVRVYIENRYNIPAMEQISDEILESLKIVDDEPGSALKNLEQILRTADLVKFAKHKPLPDENDLSLMDAYLFVNQTKIVEVKSLEEQRSAEQGKNESEGERQRERESGSEEEIERVDGKVSSSPGEPPVVESKKELTLTEQLTLLSKGEDVNNKKEEA